MMNDLIEKGDPASNLIIQEMTNSNNPTLFLENNILKPFVESWIEWSLDQKGDPSFTETVESKYDLFEKAKSFYDFPQIQLKNEFGSNTIAKSFHLYFENPFPPSITGGPQYFSIIENHLSKNGININIQKSFRYIAQGVLTSKYKVEVDKLPPSAKGIIDYLPSIINRLEISRMSCHQLLSNFI